MEEEPVSAIRFEQVSLQFPHALVWQLMIAAEVEAGQLVVILGPSGCGKTTLLKMVNRLYEPTAGKIYLDGTEVRQMKVTELRQQIGYVIQQSLVSTRLLEHCCCAEVAGLVASKNPARVDELLTLIHRPMNAIATLAAIRRSAAGWISAGVGRRSERDVNG